MKKAAVFILLLACLASGLSAGQFITTGQWSMQGSDEAIWCAARDGRVMHFGGAGTELVFNHFGIGSTILVTASEPEIDLWNIGWDLRAYMSYHFFRETAFLDPFIQAGGGAYGDTAIAGDACEGDLVHASGVNLGFYPYLAAGVGFRFRGGLYMSGQFNWRPGVASVPCCESLGIPEMREYELVLAVGFTIGGQR